MISSVLLYVMCEVSSGERAGGNAHHHAEECAFEFQFREVATILYSDPEHVGALLNRPGAVVKNIRV